jgi:hypothetical protein
MSPPRTGGNGLPGRVGESIPVRVARPVLGEG